MQDENVTVEVGGQMFSGFRRVMVRASFKEAARSFQLEIAFTSGGAATAWTFKAGTAISIYLSGDLVCRGYIDRYQPKISGHQTAEAAVSGRSKSQDYIDSSAVHDTNQFKNKDPQEIGAEIDKFGVGVATDEQLDKIKNYRITPGESAFRCLEKLCREQGVFVVGQADGSIKITKGGKTRNSAIVEGQNLLEGDADHNFAGRHSEVTVRGQKPYDHGPDALEIEGIARDAEVGRYRPVIVHHDGDTDNKRAKKRAKTRRDHEAGNSLKANATVQGFHDDGGQLWEPGALVFFQSPTLDVQQDMAIESVTYAQDRKGGSITTMSLVDPRALGGKGGKGGSAGAAWGSGAGEDE